jgi:oxazoline/thiazoline synthase
MTDNRGPEHVKRSSKALLQFAPNFTAYVLPPDVVCLYSEDRKFFLHGELYCALASAIGERVRNVGELLRELEADFPPHKIHEAIKRLLDRRYVVFASPASTGVLAASWASLGLSPETAERNLQQCRIRLQSIDVEGAAELGEALRGLGVRVVKRSPDLTVTLVSDYLDERLTELNREHLSDSTPWLLVQPSGIFPLVGPILSPRKALAGCVLRIVCGATARFGRSSIGDRRGQSRCPRWRDRRSDEVPFTWRLPRSQRPSPPIFARNCATTSSAWICWVSRS